MSMGAWGFGGLPGSCAVPQRRRRQREDEAVRGARGQSHSDVHEQGGRGGEVAGRIWRWLLELRGGSDEAYW
jgi:hypothetical protein